MNSEFAEMISREERDFFHTYRRLNIKIEKGDGCYLYTNDNRKLLDMFGGLAVNVLGYNHPAINAAIEAQLKKYIHISNYFYQDTQIELAEELIKLSGMKKVFLCNSGSEAAEAAIKLIRKYFKDSSKKTLVSFTGSFHGRTMGALSLTARTEYRESFGPLLDNVITLPFNSVQALEESINENTAGVFIELIQGEGGVNPASAEFVKTLITLRNKFDFIIVADEIQSGVGRTGKFCAYQHYGLVPDLVLMAKGIGGGLPLGALLGDERVENVFSPGDHGTTFGGNPVSAASGLAVLKELQKGVMSNAESMGKYIINGLRVIHALVPDTIKDVRGMGLMIGAELNVPCADVVPKMIEKGVLVNCTNKNVIRLLPPLIIAKPEADMFLEQFRKSI